MKYCCSEMKHADEKGIIDYAPGHLTTIDTKTEAYPIHFCPFCGAKLKGTGKSVKRIRKYFGKKRGVGKLALKIRIAVSVIVGIVATILANIIQPPYTYPPRPIYQMPLLDLLELELPFFLLITIITFGTLCLIARWRGG